MSTRSVVRGMAAAVVLCSVALSGQQKAGPPSPSGGREFPVTMRQNVEAGKTPVGARVKAQLAIATLVDGTVIPSDATFTGEVVESAAKTATDPSRLAIRMDSVQWKKGSVALKVYLTAWYYPIRTAINDDLSDASVPSAGNKVRLPGAYPAPNSAPQSSPGRDPDKPPSALPEVTASRISDHRVLMKDVDSTSNQDGVVTLTSRRFNIKLDKTTTYVLAIGELQATK